MRSHTGKEPAADFPCVPKQTRVGAPVGKEVAVARAAAVARQLGMLRNKQRRGAHPHTPGHLRGGP